MNASNAKRLLSLAISLALLALLILSVDRAALAGVLNGIHPGWFTAAIIFFIPQILAIARRWALIAQPVAPLNWREAGRQVLASNCLNLVLPSKLGDLAKGVFLYRQGRCGLAAGMQIVVFEKLLDLAALSAWMILGWMLAPRMDWWVLAVLVLGAVLVAVVWAVYFTPGAAGRLAALVPAGMRKLKPAAKILGLLESAPGVARLVHADGGRRGRIVAWSFTIWLLHLLQIACFFRAVHVDANVFEVMARMPIAIFAGLMPLSIAGVGVRDWAIVAIFASAGNPRAALVAAGLLVSLRYVVPAIGGLPYIGGYLTMARQAKEAGGKG
ncbi:MAG: glycosyltransferase 2 family protein [Candidatus Sumerlaeota bacterium]|nr:glycosyltransferase 2 family protein [Candidatus Sumerlaeota bacterium]